MAIPRRVQKLLEMAQAEVDRDAEFFATKGPGVGDRATARFITTLRTKAREAFGADLAECAVLPGTGVRADYWFPEEGLILEIAFGLHNPLSEFERDVLKAVIARAAGLPVNTLLFVSRPGAAGRLSSPWYKSVADWARERGIEVALHELRTRAA